MTPIEVLFAAAFMATTFTVIVNVIISVYSDETDGGSNEEK